MKLRISTISLALLLAACNGAPPATPVEDLDALAAEYLFLELSMGLHDGAHVDAYFGPEEIRANAELGALPLAEIENKAAFNNSRNVYFTLFFLTSSAACLKV